MSLGPAYNIPRNLDDNITIIAEYTLRDFLTIISPVLALGYIGTRLPASLDFLTTPLLGVGAVGSALILLFSPDHLGPYNWAEGILHHLSKPEEVSHVSFAASDPNTDRNPPARVYEMDSRTQDEIHVEKVHKDADAIERPDGTVVGAVKVDPANMALASQDHWIRMTNTWNSYLNNVIDYPIQIYATTKTFPAGKYMETYRDRLNDPDIKNRPVLKAVTESFAQWYPQYIGVQGTNQREFYIVIPVAPDEVYQTGKTGETVVDRLAEKPVIGGVFQRIQDQAAEEYTEEEQKREQLKELNKRLNAAVNGVRKVPECSGRPISGAELALLLKEYWEGREYNFGEDAIRETPIVMPGSEPVTPDEVSQNQGYGGSE